MIIFGPNVATLKGKTVKGKAHHMPSYTPISIPAPILDHHKEVTLCIDFFFVQKIPFFHTILQKLKFCTVTFVLNQSKATMIKETNIVLQIYHACGFCVNIIHTDMEFDCMKKSIFLVLMDIMPKDAHVPKVECSIHTIKERVHANLHNLPFCQLPRLMTTKLVKQAIIMLYKYPILDGVLTTLSPLGIMTGLLNPDYHHMTLNFGAYVQVFEDNDPQI